MSTMPPPGQPPQQGMSTLAKTLIGCTVGCFLLVLITCGGIGVVGWMIGKPLVEQGKKMEAAKEASARSMAELEKLDEQFPPHLPEDVATAEMAEDDIVRYIRIRNEFAPHLVRLASGAASVNLPTPETLGGKPSVGSIYGAMQGLLSGIAEAQAANAELLVAAGGILALEGIGPTDFARLVEIVEWRFLLRPEALALGLPEFRRDEVVEKQVEVSLLAAWSKEGVDPSWSVEPADREKAERELAEARARLAELEAEARTNVALTDATRALLEAHRAELEALGAATVMVLAPLSADPPFLRALEHGQDRSIRIRPRFDAPVMPEAPMIVLPCDPSGPSGPSGSSGPSGPSAP